MENMIENHWKIKRRNPVLYGFIIIYGGVLIFLAYKLNIWEDESYSLHTTSNNLKNVIQQSYYFEGQPPAYFLLLAVWRLINSGIFFARLLSLLFIGFSAVFFFRVVRLLSNLACSRWMLIIFLLNPFTVWAALEIRLYAMVIFLSTISMYYFLRYFIEGKNRYLYLLMITSVVGLYTQYFFVFEIAAFGCSLLIFMGWKVFLKFCLYLVPVIILCVPNMFFVFRQIETAKSKNLVYTTLNRVSSVLHSPQDLMLAAKTVPFAFGIRTGIKIIFIFVLAWGFFRLYKKEMNTSNPYFTKINIVVLTLAILLSLYCVIFGITGSYQLRYMSLLYPILILLFVIFKEFPLVARNLMYAAMSLYYISLLALQYKHPVKRYDFKTAGMFIEKNERNGEPILLYNKMLLPPFNYYYTGRNRLVALPEFIYDDEYYEENINDTTELKKTIEKINSPTKSYLMMTCDPTGFDHPVNMSPQIVNEYLRNNYTITLDTFLLGENKKYTLRIRRLEIKNK
jgi:mannosyltransferase